MLQRFGQACAIIFVARCLSHPNRQQERFLAPSSHKRRHRQRAVVQVRTGVSERRTLIRMLRVLVLIFDLSRVSASLALDESLGRPSLPTQIVPLAFVIARRFVFCGCVWFRQSQITPNAFHSVAQVWRAADEAADVGESAAAALFSGAPSVSALSRDFPLLFFTCLGMMGAVLFLFSVPFAQSCPGREILCSDGGIDWIQKGNTFMIHGTLELSCCTNTAPAHFEVLVIIPQHLCPGAGPLF